MLEPNCAEKRNSGIILPMGKYDPLYDYLRRRGTAEVEMTFRDIERVLGAMLPNSAARPQWWANEAEIDTRHVQSFAWQRAGYDAFLVAGAERVRFRLKR